MDALSDVLRAVRLSGAVFFDIHAAEPWVAAPFGATCGGIGPIEIVNGSCPSVGLR